MNYIPPPTHTHTHTDTHTHTHTHAHTHTHIHTHTHTHTEAVFQNCFRRKNSCHFLTQLCTKYTYAIPPRHYLCPCPWSNRPLRPPVADLNCGISSRISCCCCWHLRRRFVSSVSATNEGSWLTAWGENTAILALSAIACAFRLLAVQIIKSLTIANNKSARKTLTHPSVCNQHLCCPLHNLRCITLLA